ncbi:ATP-binding protein [Amycolatopsis sp., V23-08]|uniref:Sensor-like histidine kinase SenX3 n=1 Tax=Amycolatopsis heterodermiae TaxID=3110235 RepID=A0ABU5R265_9PSEU|nr:ATP-binding protein [Amycolatopsis sp., V23-08]MEA5360293.1 ATP-binding protein [Amycolatopsis sp., V23-08]
MSDTGAAAAFEPAERDRTAEAVAGPAFDFSVCVTEPIHRLGGIQSYGALVAVADDGLVEVASSTTTRLLGRTPEELIGTPVAALLGAEGVAAVQQTLDAPTGDRGLLALRVPEDGPEFDVTVYRADGRLVLELEPATAHRPFRFSQFYPSVRAALTRLQHGRTVVDVCAAAVAEIRALTGYDRVVAYRFEGRAGPGEVIAEAIADGLEPWVGLWFPATDIPPQARRLYERNWIRVINDVGDATSALHPQTLPGGTEPLDLSDSTLRTVSSFHLEYLRNIGVGSSMSVSLLREGTLWGLIACHGLAPRRLDPEVRAACEFFGVTLSLQLAALQEAETARARQEARTALSRLVAALETDPAPSLPDNGELLAGLVRADAVVLRLGGTASTVLGDLDPALLWPVVPELAAGEVWASDCLTEHAPGLAAHADSLSGALVLGLGHGDLVAWTRRERRADRTWAADPDRPVQLGPHGERLTPRGSSAVYQAVVRGHSLPWTAADEAVAADLGRAVSSVALRQAARLAGLNTQLRRANQDLDTFAHAAAHEMKEPLRGIATTVAFIGEDAGETLDATTLRRLETVESLANRMDELVNSLLHFAQLGQADLRREPVGLRAAAGRALEIAGPRLAENEVEPTLPGEDVTVSADPARLEEILVNLLVNAAKYARAERPRTVEVGLRPADGDHAAAVFVRDNGIGIPEVHQQDVLRLFRRLHARDAYGGGHGAGLAIVDRIVQRHGGRLSLASTPGAGTTVWFTLEPDPEPRS